MNTPRQGCGAIKSALQMRNTFTSKTRLAGDPFNFSRTVDYSKRNGEILEKIKWERDRFYCLERVYSNFFWICKRAVIVLLDGKLNAHELRTVTDSSKADEILRLKPVVDLRKEWPELFSISEESVAKWKDKKDEEKNKLINALLAAAQNIQYRVYRAKKKDIYKKLKGYPALEYVSVPIPSNCLFDLDDL